MIRQRELRKLDSVAILVALSGFLCNEVKRQANV